MTPIESIVSQEPIQNNEQNWASNEPTTEGRNMDNQNNNNEYDENDLVTRDLLKV